MSEPKYTAMMALHHALHAKPVEFENAVNGMLADRIQDAVEKKREEVAKSVFGGENPEVETDDQDAVTPEGGETGELESEVETDVEPETDEIEETPTEEEAPEVAEVPEEEKEEAPVED